MAQQTRLGVSGFTRAPYGSFSGKVETVSGAYSLVLDNVTWFDFMNVPRLLHQAVVDTSLSEFSVTPQRVSWLGNRPRVILKQIKT